MVDAEDKKLFRNTVDNQPLLDKDADFIKSKNQVKTQPIFHLQDYSVNANLSGSEPVSHNKTRLPAKIIKQMKHGKIPPCPTLDLHGQTVKEAHISMAKFIHHHQHKRYVHIIHGKGHHAYQGLSVLKSQVVYYLKQHPAILSFVSCPPKDGGTGAVFVLLKTV